MGSELELEGNCGKYGHALGQVLSEKDTSLRRTHAEDLQFSIFDLSQLPQHHYAQEVQSGCLSLGAHSQVADDVPKDGRSPLWVCGLWKSHSLPLHLKPQESDSQGSREQPRSSHCVKIPRAEVIELNIPSHSKVTRLCPLCHLSRV